MSSKTLICNARIVNEGQVKDGAILIENDTISEIYSTPNPDISLHTSDRILDAGFNYVLPGVIDDQVHFRQPGLTHKAQIYTESMAAVTGGVTSFMEMPNTLPQAITTQLLDEKFQLAAQESFANFSFYMGATNQNTEELLKIDPARVCGIKVFMGASTGNMLVDSDDALEAIFSNAKTLVAVHCEDETTIRENLQIYQGKFGENIPPEYHPRIRNHHACLLSSEKAVALAQKHNTRLHVLHLSTAGETRLFDNTLPLEKKRITGEVCVHHLWFTDDDYAAKGNFIKWNPAIKSKKDREKLWESIINGTLDVVATDHAPHLKEEKSQPYLKAPSGGPLVQHSLQAMFDAVTDRSLPVHLIAQWMSHNPAVCFKVYKRGFIRKGYFADLVILDPDKPYTVNHENILYKCKWSPFEGHTFRATPTHTIINGQVVFQNGKVDQDFRGQPLEFVR